MICTLEVIDPTGHLTLEWDPDDAQAVKRAEAEFDRLQEAGFAFFTSASPDADRVEGLDDELRAKGELDARLVQTREHQGEAEAIDDDRVTIDYRHSWADVLLDGEKINTVSLRASEARRMAEMVRDGTAPDQAQASVKNQEPEKRELQRTDKPRRRARRTVAVAPMQGG